ncbi:hypothetical protein ACLOJK_035879 [Asimina triloba]
MSTLPELHPSQHTRAYHRPLERQWVMYVSFIRSRSILGVIGIEALHEGQTRSGLVETSVEGATHWATKKIGVKKQVTREKQLETIEISPNTEEKRSEEPKADLIIEIIPDTAERREKPNMIFISPDIEERREKLTPEMTTEISSSCSKEDERQENLSFSRKKYEELKEKLLKENHERKNLQNELIVLKGNITVFCRCRALREGEIEGDSSSIVEIDGQEMEVQSRDKLVKGEYLEDNAKAINTMEGTRIKR